MFIVYSPEGRNFIGDKQRMPGLKVDPVNRVLPIGDSEMDQQLNFEETYPSPQGASKSALEQYESVQHEKERTLVVKVSDIMVQPVITVTADRSLVEAWEIMRNSNIQHLPVVNESSDLIGLISAHDILMRGIMDAEGNIEEIRDGNIADVMNEEVITTKVNTDIRRVAFVMSEYGLGCLPIMSEVDTVIGIVTLSDIVRRLAEQPPLEIYA
ncbi:CBS domain-containing protein [Hydrogenovibrio sp. 3SP14C1]|uniref:CBS domain-containing protein n=1 Tax=Hydrogenovibrio sp. 3SP14C1 TaxID=3038774 RepID=UPI00241653C5|nr:CBS domain-containing protein [Hydrogenovibrio sp. 3SP14C1]MDG4812992.1 CBS domain-containing protein [Hydrogenovibrio sp. 3SP14C1]